MHNSKKRKITAWGYQYDNGEVALLYHDAGSWRGKKINTVQSEYYCPLKSCHGCQRKHRIYFGI